MKRRMFTRVVFCLAVILALTTWETAETQAQSQKALTKFTVLMPGPSAVQTMNFWVAVGEGYFKDEGLEGNWEAVDGSSQVLQGLASGKAQIGRPGPGPVLAARARGVDVVSIYNLYPKSQFALVVKQNSSYKTPVELKGRVIGIGTADGGETAFARTVLTGSNMAEGKDYKFLTVGDGGIAAAAFERGDIDAYSASMFDAATITARGIPLREITPAEYITLFGSSFVAMGSYIKERPDVIKGFGRAMVRGVKFAKNKDNREKVLAYCKMGNPQEVENKVLSSALLDKALDRMTPFDLSLDFGYQPSTGWQRWMDSSVASGILKAPLPNLEAVYTNEFVKYWNGKR